MSAITDIKTNPNATVTERTHMTTFDVIREVMEGTGWIVWLVFAGFAIFLAALVAADRLQAKQIQHQIEEQKRRRQVGTRLETVIDPPMTEAQINEMNQSRWDWN